MTPASPILLPTVGRHLVREFARTFLLTLLAFIAIYLIVDFFDRFDDYLRHDAALDAQELDDGEVLDGLRHDAVVGGHHEQEEVDAGGAGHHGAHEALVAGDVDHADPPAAGQLELGVAELDRDAALALFAQPVGVRAGQPGDERRLAVVDVPRRTERERGLAARHGRPLRVGALGP